MDKPRYRTSNMVNYFICPKKYRLSTEHSQKQTEAMRNGLLFESYLFGFRDDETKKELIGRKKETSLEKIKSKADKIRELFEFDGESFKKFKIDFEEFLITGEADFIGDAVINGEKKRCIIDTKFTGNIDRNWNYRNSKREFIQSCMYPFLELWERSGDGTLPFDGLREPLPFYYLIIEDNDYSDCLWKMIEIKTTIDDMKWIWGKIKQIHGAKEIGYPANDSEDNCLGRGAYSAKCPYLEFCEEGRKLITFPVSINFNQLGE